jgi:hypothetical protein
MIFQRFFKTSLRRCSVLFLLACGACSQGSGTSTSRAGSLADGHGGLMTVTAAPSLGSLTLMCPEGYEHPTVCCLGAPGSPPQCGEYDSSPFMPCAANWAAFPDQARCCSLTNPADCGKSAIPVSAERQQATATCYEQCGPRGFPPSALPRDGAAPPPSGEYVCCTDTGGTLGCVYSSCVSTPGSVCIDDGDAGCASPPEPNPHTCGPTCPACPSGWESSAHGQVDLCCQTVDGTERCFSQAGEIR